MKINNVTAVFVRIGGVEGHLDATGWVIPDPTVASILNAAYTMERFNELPTTISRERNDLYALALWAQRSLEKRLEIIEFLADVEDIPDGATL